MEQEKNGTSVRIRNITKDTWIGLITGAAVVGVLWIAFAQTNPNNSVILTINGKPITQNQLQQEENAIAGTQSIEELVGQTLFVDGAKAHHMSATQAQINQTLASIKAENHITTQAQWNALLAEQHMTQSALINNIAANIDEQNLASQNVHITRQEELAFYKENKKTMTSPHKKAPSFASVQSIIITELKAQKATPVQTLIPKLAKEENVRILDPNFSWLTAQLNG